MDSCVLLLKTILDKGQPYESMEGARPVESLASFQDCPDCPVMRRIPEGRLMWVDPAAAVNGKGMTAPVQVMVRAFALGEAEVTNRQFKAFLRASGYRPRAWTPGMVMSDEQPVASVSYADARAYTAWLGQKTGRTYRLPSETEWEFAARGGTGVKVAQVNSYGLHNLLGGVWEMVEDCWRDSRAMGTATGNRRSGGCDGQASVIRGGPLPVSRVPGVIRMRESLEAGATGHTVGFRVAAGLVLRGHEPSP